MNKLRMLAVWLLFGCAAATQTTAPHDLRPHTRSVTRRAAFNGSEIPAAYQRSSDTPGFVWVLWSREGLCIVDAYVWINTRIGDLISCDWRSPR